MGYLHGINLQAIRWAVPFAKEGLKLCSFFIWWNDIWGLGLASFPASTGHHWQSFVWSQPKMCGYYHLPLPSVSYGNTLLPWKRECISLPEMGTPDSWVCLPTLVLTHCWASGCLVSLHPSFPIYGWSLLPDLINVCKMFMGSWINGACV